MESRMYLIKNDENHFNLMVNCEETAINILSKFGGTKSFPIPLHNKNGFCVGYLIGSTAPSFIVLGALELNIFNCIRLWHDIDLEKIANEHLKDKNNLSFKTSDYNDGYYLKGYLAGLLKSFMIFHPVSPSVEYCNLQMDVYFQMEEDVPTPFVKRNVIRRLDNGEEIEWKCFFDNGWWDTSGIKIPNVISWQRLPETNYSNCVFLTDIKTPIKEFCIFS